MTPDETRGAPEERSDAKDDFVIEVSDEGIVVKRGDVAFRIPRGAPRSATGPGRPSPVPRPM